uniref:Uncharacterized protein n=1 Tax=Eptatretus burgeri TaxID=7764 RepID=A0A8C4WUU5_EPTBU
MVVWGCQVPRHHISCLLLTNDQGTVITGCRDGELCLWNLSSSLELTPRALLLAHHAAVTCLSRASDDKEELNSYVEFEVNAGVKFYRRPWGGTAAQTLLCCGEYTDVTVVDARSLQLLGRFSSKLMPDWVVALSVLSHRGTIGTVHNIVFQDPAPIYENEARPMFLMDGCTVTFCRQSPWALLLVCHHIWKVFRSKDFSTLCLLMAEEGEPWAGGDFLAVDKVIVWTQCQPNSVNIPITPLINTSFLSFTPDLGVTSKASMEGSFPQIEPPLDCDGRSLGRTTEPQDHVTASLHLPAERCLLCGCADGRIVLLPLVEFAFASVIQEEVGALSGVPNSRVLLGHRGPVSCLLIPHQASACFNHNWLLSGGSDGTVRMWDMAVGTELHMFHGHTGTITQLIVPPEVCFRRGVTICSVASDHSVAMLSLVGIRPMVLTSAHPFPVVAVRWRHAERLLFIACSDGSLFVWQSSTGKGGLRVVAQSSEININEYQVVKLLPGGVDSACHPSDVGKMSAICFLLSCVLPTFQANCCDGGPPAVSVLPLSAGGVHIAAHVLVFCLDSLILELKVETQPQDLVSKEVKPAAAAMEAQYIPHRKRRSAKEFLHHLTVTRGSQVRKTKAESHDLHEGDKNKVSQLQEIESEEYEKQKLMQARLLMSCLHTWGLDLKLDAACEKHLELFQLKHPISFGLLSHGNQVIKYGGDKSQTERVGGGETGEENVEDRKTTDLPVGERVRDATTRPHCRRCQCALVYPV